jgi:hypothetical protein
MRCITGGVCRLSGEVCAADSDCCNGLCEDGYCAKIEGQGVVSCRVVGEACDQASDCCSYSCFDDGTGFKSCHYLGGCRPYGELCTDSSQCCSSADSCNGNATPAECVPLVGNDGVERPVGRCDLIQGPKPAGEVCDSRFAGTHDCCGGDDACKATTLGIERCFGAEFTPGDGTPPVECLMNGADCAISDQCCSGLCAPDMNGDLKCTDGTCTPDGDACTNSGDCCSGNCNSDGVCGAEDMPMCTANGVACTMDGDCCSNYCDPMTMQCGTPSMCAELGDACTNNSDCCNNRCASGTCQQACLALGNGCTSNSDCCSNYCDPASFTCGEATTTCKGIGDTCDTTGECCDGLTCGGVCGVIGG